MILWHRSDTPNFVHLHDGEVCIGSEQPEPVPSQVIADIDDWYDDRTMRRVEFIPA